MHRDKPMRFNYIAKELTIAVVLIGALFSPATTTTVYPIQTVIGQSQQYKVRTKESLVEIARRFDLGYNSIVAANPGVDPYVPRPGSLITIPVAWIPPAVSVRPSLVVNLPEFRLYYFPKDPAATVITFPLGIGDEGTDTPVGKYTVINKVTAPSWYVPRSIQGKRPGSPKVVPPGPANPLGSHAISLSQNSIVIHGTNKPWGIGRRSSHGCLRLYPEDIKILFDLVHKGMLVEIINQPLKVGLRGKRVFVEVHLDKGRKQTAGDALHMLEERDLLLKADISKVVLAFKEKRGVPVDVTSAHLFLL